MEFNNKGMLDYIKYEMKKQNITLKDLGFFMKTTESAVSLKLSGKRKITLEEIIIISTILNIDLSTLIKKGEK